MAAKSDFTDEEWETMQKGVTGAGLLVSVSDPGFMDSFGEAKALAKELAAEHTANTSELIRELAHSHGTGFGLTSSAEKVTSETIDALHASMALLAAKAPDDQAAYRQLVLDVANAVANAKGGVKPGEEAAIQKITEALGPG
jgi:hypothetical protein